MAEHVQTQAAILQLPNELLLRIASDLRNKASPRDLWSFCATCKWFGRIGQEYLFEFATISCHEDHQRSQVICLIRTLIERPDLAHNVTALSLPIRHSDRKDGNRDAAPSPGDEQIVTLCVEAATGRNMDHVGKTYRGRNIALSDENKLVFILSRELVQYLDIKKEYWAACLAEKDQEALVAASIALTPNLQHLELHQDADTRAYSFQEDGRQLFSQLFDSKKHLECLTLRNVEPFDYILKLPNPPILELRHAARLECNFPLTDHASTLTELRIHCFPSDMWNSKRFIRGPFGLPGLLRRCLGLKVLKIYHEVEPEFDPVYKWLPYHTYRDLMRALEIVRGTLETLEINPPRHWPHVRIGFWHCFKPGMKEFKKLKWMSVPQDALIDSTYGRDSDIHYVPAGCLPLRLESLRIFNSNEKIVAYLEDLLVVRHKYPDLTGIELLCHSKGSVDWYEKLSKRVGSQDAFCSALSPVEAVGIEVSIMKYAPEEL